MGHRIGSGPSMSSASSASSRILNDVSSETTRPVETKLHLESPWGGGTKFYL